MALTRPRAAQIYDIDYKQATRVVTVSDITLAGGAPNQVDGVNLSTNDRVLVTGQSTPSQNGVYYVSIAGSGSNGTWVRSQDTNATGELLGGTVVMVTEGLIYADTQWKLTTDDPIIIGTTPLVFVQNYSANSISSGTSNVVVYSNANVAISSSGTSNVLTVSSTGIVVSGTESVTGNVTADHFVGNGSTLTSITGANITGTVANATYAISANNSTYSGTVTTNAQPNITSVGVLTSLSSAGNITGDNIFGNNINSTIVSASGNVTGNYFIGNGSQLTGISPSSISNGTSNVVIPTLNGNTSIYTAGQETVEVSPGELTVYGVFSNPKTITSNVVIGPNINSMLIGPISVDPNSNIFVPTGSTLNII